MERIVTSLLDLFVEVGNFGARGLRTVHYVGLVRGAYVGERTYPSLIVEIVQMCADAENKYVQEGVGDLVTTWIGDGRFVRQVWRCAGCGAWAPSSEITEIPMPSGAPLITHRHGIGCKASAVTP